MAHSAQIEFVASVAAKFPSMFYGARVLEVGSLNINGTVRDFFHACEYVGVDVVPGPCVDVVSLAHDLPAMPLFAEPFDVVISCEALEHDRFWPRTLAAMFAILRPGGLMVFTCAGPGRREHGTRCTSPEDSGTCQIEAWPDYYGNLSEQDILAQWWPVGGFKEHEFSSARGGIDTQFWGVKGGAT